MTNTHTNADVDDTARTGAAPDTHAMPPDGSQPDVVDRIAAMLRGLKQIEIGPMGRAEAQRTLRALRQADSKVMSLIRDVASHVADSYPDADLAEMLHRSGADLSPDTRLNSRDTA